LFSCYAMQALNSSLRFSNTHLHNSNCAYAPANTKMCQITCECNYRWPANQPINRSIDQPLQLSLLMLLDDVVHTE
jgi:hypothetical protein